MLSGKMGKKRIAKLSVEKKRKRKNSQIKENIRENIKSEEEIKLE